MLESVLREFHPTKNSFSISDLRPYSKNKVWWQCHKDPSHEWEACPSNRFGNHSSCPFCTGKKAHPTNCLAKIRPDLAKEWHPNKNGDFTPNDVTSGSKKKVWWKCPHGNDHEWEAMICDRRKRGCPVCKGKKTVLSNSLANLRPDFVKQWHNSLNELTPLDITPGSNKKVWWKCEQGEDHEWQASPTERVRGYNCPFCSGHRVARSTSLGTLKPELAKQWHSTLNDITAYDVTLGSHYKAWWVCPVDTTHEWRTYVLHRTNGSDCPYCVQKSKGESSIEYFLVSNSIPYIKQFKFDDCRHKKVLRFDFRIMPIDKVPAVIEFNGDQHYRSIEYFGGESRFLEGKKRDQIKVDYCLDHSIPLLVVPYKDLKIIDSILSRFIVKLPFKSI